MTLESLDDSDLLEQIKGGHHAAFAALVRRHSTSYYRLAYHYVARQDEAEDIVQTAFLKLWEKPHAWNPQKNTAFTSWFYRIVVNLCIDRLKKPKSIPIPENFEVCDDRQNQEKNYADQKKKQAIAAEIATLPKRQKTALILCFYEGMSHEQAAKVMKVSIKALQSLLMRAKNSLKNQLARQGTL